MLPKFVRSPRDLGAGLVYLTLGGAAALVARGYPLGSAGGLGPGSLPLALGLLLVAMGVVSLLRCIALETEKIGHVAWRGLFLVTAAMLICALLAPRGRRDCCSCRIAADKRCSKSPFPS